MGCGERVRCLDEVRGIACNICKHKSHDAAESKESVKGKGKKRGEKRGKKGGKKKGC